MKNILLFHLVNNLIQRKYETQKKHDKRNDTEH